MAVETKVPENYYKEKMEYTWEKDATRKAELELGKNIEDTRKQFIQERSNVLNQGQQAQQQIGLSNYSDNQSIEKAGWTGGYVLDARKQSEYLKQSIASQMYGQMELQKMGYDSQLASARLAYDIGKQDLARQYYQDAVSNAVQESQVTGMWISPEVKDISSQYQSAMLTLEQFEGMDEDILKNTPEYQRAKQVTNAIEGWFASTGLSKAGVKTLAKLAFELDEEVFNESRIQAAIESMTPGQYAKRKDDGSYEINEATGRPEIFDLNVASVDEQWDYFNTKYGKSALKSQVNNLAATTLQNFINNTPGLSEMSDEDFQAKFQAFLQGEGNDLVKQYLASFGDKDVQAILKEAYPELFVNGAYQYTMSYGDQKYTYTIAGDIIQPGGTGGTDGTGGTGGTGGQDGSGGQDGTGGTGGPEPVKDTVNQMITHPVTGQLILNPDFEGYTSGLYEIKDGKYVLKDGGSGSGGPKGFENINHPEGFLEQETNFILTTADGIKVSFSKEDWHVNDIRQIVVNPNLSLTAGTVIAPDDQASYDALINFAKGEGWTGAGKGKTQDNYLRGIVDLAKAGAIPDGTYIDLNFASGITYSRSNYAYIYNGHIFITDNISKPNGAVNNKELFKEKPYYAAYMATKQPNIETVTLNSSTQMSDFGLSSINPYNEEYYRDVMQKARAGEIPEYAIINMSRSGDNFYTLVDGKFYKVDNDYLPGGTRGIITWRNINDWDNIVNVYNNDANYNTFYAKLGRLTGTLTQFSKNTPPDNNVSPVDITAGTGMTPGMVPGLEGILAQLGNNTPPPKTTTSGGSGGNKDNIKISSHKSIESMLG